MDDIYLIAGLGNPGKDYEKTRHNAGFLVLEEWVRQRKANWTDEGRFQARVARWRDGSKTLIACEPQTYMNASGESVGPLLRFYRVPLKNLMVIVDDADLPLGQIRMRSTGSSGGHHGLESVESHVGSREYARLRVGIGRVEQARRDIAGHVLGRFSSEEEPFFRRVAERCRVQLECWLTDGIAKAMSQFNGAVAPEQRKGN